MGGQVRRSGLLHVPRTMIGPKLVRSFSVNRHAKIALAMYLFIAAALLKAARNEPGEAVRISVDIPIVDALIQGHHTVTHFLHWALHEVVSRDAAQKGSYVGPDKLTFDFSSAPLTTAANARRGKIGERKN